MHTLDRPRPRAELGGLVPHMMVFPLGSDTVLRVLGEKGGRGRKRMRRIIHLRLSDKNKQNCILISSVTSAHVAPQPEPLSQLGSAGLRNRSSPRTPRDGAVTPRTPPHPQRGPGEPWPGGIRPGPPSRSARPPPRPARARPR